MPLFSAGQPASGRSRARRPAPAGRRFRPRIEDLERRDLLAVVSAAAAAFSLVENTSLTVPAAAVQVAQTGDGEVTLPATAGSEFSGDSLPAGWQTIYWPGTGGGTVN